MIILFCMILWCIFASLEGNREGIHFYYRNIIDSEKWINNEHPMFSVQRIIALIPFAYVMFDPKNCWTLLNGIFLWLTFALLHDGFYYAKRNKLDGSYPKGFLSYPSSGSNSLWDSLNLTTPIARITYFVIGVFGIIIINFTKY